MEAVKKIKNSEVIVMRRLVSRAPLDQVTIIEKFIEEYPKRFDKDWKPVVSNESIQWYLSSVYENEDATNDEIVHKMLEFLRIVKQGFDTGESFEAFKDGHKRVTNAVRLSNSKTSEEEETNRKELVKEIKKQTKKKQ